MSSANTYRSLIGVLLSVVILRHFFSGFGKNDHYPGIKDSHSEDFEPPLEDKNRYSPDSYQCKIRNFFGVTDFSPIEPKSIKKNQNEVQKSSKPGSVDIKKSANLQGQILSDEKTVETLDLQPQKDGEFTFKHDDQEFICCYKDPRNPILTKIS